MALAFVAVLTIPEIPLRQHEVKPIEAGNELEEELGLRGS